MKPSVFISKELSTNSIFKQALNNAGWSVTNIFLLDIKAQVPATLPPCDWIFFYSKRAVQIVLDQHQLPTNIQLAAIGPGTAQCIREKGYLVQFAGTGQPAATAAAFGQIAAGSRVLFPRAAHSRKSVQQLLAQQVEVIDLVVYDNSIRSHFEIPYCQYLIFTSPLNAQAYYQRYPVDRAQRVVAIGSTTAQQLVSLGISNCRISPEPTEEALLNILLEWEKTKPSGTEYRTPD